MDKNTKVHAEYRVEVYGEASGKWRPYNSGTVASMDDAKKVLQAAMEFMPRKYGWKHRISVRLIGDWCEMKEENKK